MDVLKIKPVSKIIVDYIKILKYKNKKVEIKGSSSLQSQQYYSDIDLFSDISSITDRTISSIEVDREFMRILHHANLRHDMYFIEFKIQTLHNKYKFHKIEDITESQFIKDFKDVTFIKIDFVVRLNYKFMELSIIYNFDKKYEDVNFINMMNDDIKELIKEKNYYKVLKRVFSKLAYQKEEHLEYNKELLIFLSKFFNSEYGKEYQEVNNLKALDLLLTHYDDVQTIRLVLDNLKDIKIEPNIKIIKSTIKQKEAHINKEAKIIYKNI